MIGPADEDVEEDQDEEEAMDEIEITTTVKPKIRRRRPIAGQNPKLSSTAHVENNSSDISNSSSFTWSIPQPFGFLNFSPFHLMIQNFQNRLFNDIMSRIPQIKVEMPSMPQMVPLMPTNPRFSGFKIIVTPIEEQQNASGQQSRWFDGYKK